MDRVHQSNKINQKGCGMKMGDAETSGIWILEVAGGKTSNKSTSYNVIETTML